MSPFCCVHRLHFQLCYRQFQDRKPEHSASHFDGYLHPPTTASYVSNGQLNMDFGSSSSSESSSLSYSSKPPYCSVLGSDGKLGHAFSLLQKFLVGAAEVPQLLHFVFAVFHYKVFIRYDCSPGGPELCAGGSKDGHIDGPSTYTRADTADRTASEVLPRYKHHISRRIYL